MSALLSRLSEKALLIADGAWGTELAKRGLEPGEAPEKWNLERPDEVRAVAAAYVEAGSDVLLTNTFGGSPFKLAKVGIDAVDEVNRRGVELSVEAAAGKALVLADIGPSGEFMEPLGTLSRDALIAGFTAQTQALLAGNPDGFIIETMTDLGEATAVMEAVRRLSELPVVVTMTFTKGPKGYATMMGVTPETAAHELEAAGADVVGANCGSGIVDIIEVAKLMRPATDLPLWFKPNAGLPKLVDGETVFRETPEEMAAHFEELIAAGAGIVGGCCGTTPEHIRLFVAGCCGTTPEHIRQLRSQADRLT